MSDGGYRPLACDVHDQLEAFAVRRDTVRIRYRDPGGAEREAGGIILDVWAEGGAEYLRLEDRTTIRLDRLTSVVRHPTA